MASLIAKSPVAAQTATLKSSFLGSKPQAKAASAALPVKKSDARVVCMAGDRWGGLGRDGSDDQQDITRGYGMVDAAFQGAQGIGTHKAVLSSYDYVSQGQRSLQWDNTKDGYYIAPAFMDKVVVHLAKNFMKLPNIKVPLILGVWGGKGQGKTFQMELIFAKLGINPIMMSAGELESGNAGEPAALIRQRYREASDVIKKGKMCCLFINDLDAGAGRMGGTTQYTVNNQMVNATLMNIADNPTNVQLPGMYNKDEIPRVPIIVTGNDFSTLYAPLIRDGRMEKFYWAPTRDDRVGVAQGIFRLDGVPEHDVTTLVDTFPGQSIDFFGALRARVYDDEVRRWVAKVGVDNVSKHLVNSRSGPPKFDQPAMNLETLLAYGNMLVKEQENVKRVQLADTYLASAALGDANKDQMEQGTFFEGGYAQQVGVPVPAGCSDPNAVNYDPTVRSDDGSLNSKYDFTALSDATLLLPSDTEAEALAKKVPVNKANIPRIYNITAYHIIRKKYTVPALKVLKKSQPIGTQLKQAMYKVSQQNGNTVSFAKTPNAPPAAWTTIQIVRLYAGPYFIAHGVDKVLIPTNTRV
ncbi:unnamed protein product [Closterium sp. Naga37s-1]|nr:unnamed protein product [Closterium sp. Naga37s-1]